MRYFAKVENGVVVDVLGATDRQIVAEMFIGWDGWIETDPNTQGNVYLGDDGKAPLRKNFAYIGYTYDAELDAFIPPKPNYPSWVLNRETGLWEAPVPLPADSGTGEPAKGYKWDEPNLAWVTDLPEGYGWITDIGGWGVVPAGYVLDAATNTWSAPEPQ